MASNVLGVETNDDAILLAKEWSASGPAKALVQLAHGAAEHLGRYEAFARHLSQAGYHVFGADHRGHGVNVLDRLGSFGPGGFAGVIEDLTAVAQQVRSRHPGIPLVLFGHSMGSFASQVILADRPDLIDGLILSGTAAIDELLSDRSASGSLTALNAEFEPARTPFDWLTRDNREVDAYIADPLCGFDLELASLASMPTAVTGVRDRERLAAAVKRNLPVYVISGASDPVTGPGQSSARAVVASYQAAGLQDVEHIIYAGGRHEMLNEVNRDEVMCNIVEWLDAHFGGLSG